MNATVAAPAPTTHSDVFLPRRGRGLLAIRHLLEPAGAGTRLTLEGEISGEGWAGVLRWLASGRQRLCRASGATDAEVGSPERHGVHRDDDGREAHQERADRG